MNRIDQRISDFTNHTFGSWRIQKAWSAPLLIKDAEGVHLYDDRGRPYIDFSSQLMCSNLGHKNRVIIDAMIRQAEKLPYIAPGFVSEAAMEAVQALQSVMPAGLDKFFFSTSGTEANEAALKMSRQSRAPAFKVISRYHAYHGATAAAISMTGDPRRWYAEQARCTVQGIRFAPDCYCYRCPFALTYPACDVRCARYLDYMIAEEGNVAAIIVEPVVGTNGRLVPPPEYFPLVRKICDEHDVLLVADEVMSGWFRTGPAFAMDHWGVVPDILTTAKGSTGAYTPAGITAAAKSVSDHFNDELFCHGHTYSFHPMALCAIPAAVSEYSRLMASGLPEKAAAHLKEKLYALPERHECIGDVRGMGHFWALEIVKNRETKAPFDTKSDQFGRQAPMTARIAADAMQNGLYIVFWYDTLVVAPPLIISESEIDEAIDILDKSLKIGDAEAVSTGVAASRTSDFAPSPPLPDDRDPAAAEESRE